jgi:hypothetical protein
VAFPRDRIAVKLTVILVYTFGVVQSALALWDLETVVLELLELFCTPTVPGFNFASSIGWSALFGPNASALGNPFRLWFTIVLSSTIGMYAVFRGR